MLNKLKKGLHTDNFSYFIRYFAVFTLIFGLMSIIILNLMRATMYHTSDETFNQIHENPSLVINFALARGTVPDVNWFNANADDGRPKLALNTNYYIILYNRDGAIMNNVDILSGLSSLKLNKSHVNDIEEIQVESLFGEKEYYRKMTIKLTPQQKALSIVSNVQYVTVLFNTTQIREAISSYETTVIVVMIVFWLISIVASIYLATVSVRPILISYQRQKDFVENASHELRTPLAVLQNRLESLFRNPDATILDSSESIASSLEEVRNMRLLTTNLLNLARRDDGLKPNLVDIPVSFFEKVLKNYQLIAEENGKTLEIHHHLWTAIYSDKILLKQVMTILFDNAMKYTDENGHIKIELVATDRQLIYRVTDNGLGIRDEDKKKIFDRFYRVDKARTRQKGGFGLGLSLAKQILDSLDGTISVQDNLPQGSIFEVRIPR
ncbi:HAMP domain-containing histidine kinase [Streptococcus gallolyticus]|nr:HAMP domain-containing histidine kinase [Streptococcus gallolyticus]MBY5041261.1 HAMP domain-containing histidine kinase [Streptococcus gallolyticus]